MRSIRESSALVLLGIFLSLVARAQTDSQPAPTKDHPQLQIDLRKVGYETSQDTSARRHTSTDFIDANHLAISWLTTHKRTAANPGEPTELHVLVLDVNTGEKKGLQSYSTPISAVRFAGVPDGKFVICTGGLLRLFSEDFKELRELQLPNDHGCHGALETEGTSPSRKSLLLSDPWAQGKNGRKSLLNLETFVVTAEWQENCYVQSISDRWLAGKCGPTRERKFFIRPLDQPWQPFQPVSDPIGAVAFIRDQILAVGAKNQVAVTTIDGKILFKVSLPDHDFALRFATSTGGDRFAAVEGKLRGLRSEPLDMYPFISQDRAVVYSVSDRRAIYVVNVKGTSPWAPWAPHLNHVALSPDGTLLALVSDDILRVYRLPETTPATNFPKPSESLPRPPQ